ncbi:hypothetical protein KGM_210187 [Danaus plexippus plexippus]|uniref:Methionine--tRNA ligase, cytoplasmic n=1 Tax=Danaus plexippus plexippus TaxID=278856 RepID=A0A212F767_DANPL|nr:hypothetical protein KGM_210187 [Danaus plexippus plexippus]
MKIYTNENNTATLKLLIAAKLAGKDVELLKGTHEESPGPAVLPRLEVHEELSFFSSNAAVQYLFPVLDLSQNGQCLQMLEWEATRLYPVVSTVLTSKTVSSELKEALNTSLLIADNLLAKHQYILGDKLSPVDVSIFSTLYPLCCTDLKDTYLKEYSHVLRWSGDIGNSEAVQEAVKQWGGSPNSPPSASSLLGTPQVVIQTPTGSPDEVPEKLSAEELEMARDNFLNGINKLQPPLKREGVVLPDKDRRNVLITSALPYVNNVPHLGNIIGCVLSADIFSRYCRLCGFNTLFVCGTDEYGTATETKALEEGVTPRQICDKYFAIHDAVYRWFNIDFDYFGRTSTEQQTRIAQDLFKKLNANGFVSKQTVEQLYCEKCDRFLADRFVEGTCPHPGCLYDNARGDQCDKCGKLINAVELREARCKVCSSSPAVRNSDQLFIELPQLEPSLRSWASRAEAGWSGPARAVLRAWMRDKLRCRAVTRDLKWGVPVPITGFENKVFYVWFDAPIGYLSITECATGNYEKWWKRSPDYDVKLYQFMAKDNVPFHVIMFPATVIGVNEGHLLVDHIYATEYLNYEDTKFSKSRGVGVFGTDARDTGIPSDVWRFYLAMIRPETSDSSFSWADLATRNNSELLNNLGNFCHRSLSFCYSSFSAAVPDTQLTPTDLEIIAGVNRDVVAYVQHLERGRLRDALRHVLRVSRAGNLYMQDTQPWALLKGGTQDRVKAATTIGVCCELVALLAALLAPYMPDTSKRLCTQLNIDQSELRINPTEPCMVRFLGPGHTINKPEPLFTKIEQQTVDELRRKYAGTQADRRKSNGDCKKLSAAELEAAISAQGEKVRKLKSSTKDKAVWQPEVDVLLALKKQLTLAHTHADQQTGSAAELERAVAEQGDKVRKLKASTKDKTVWQPEVNKLLALKKQLAEHTDRQTGNHSPGSVEQLEKAIAEQGDKVRKLKASTKDKSVWQPEVNVLLDLKKQLTALQANK